MTSYLPNSHAVDVGAVLYSPTSVESTASAKKEGRGLQGADTVASAGGSAKKTLIPSERPGLPPSQPKSSSDEMMIIAAAFCKAYSSMALSVETQTTDYASLQQLSQTQSQSILQSTTNAINKQEAAEKQAADIAAYQEHMAEVQKIMGWVMFGIGIALTIATIGSAFLDGGASLAAVPEEIEMLEVVGEGAEGAIEAGADVGADAAADAGADLGADAAADSSEASTQSENLTQQTSRTLESSESAENASESTAKKVLLKIGKLGFQAVLGIPMALKGATSLQVSDRLSQLAKAQKDVGEALDKVSQNNAFFQFMQQLLQREGSVLNEEASDASEVIDTYAAVTSALRGISAGLANAA